MTERQPTLRGGTRQTGGAGPAFVGTVLIHGVAVGMLFADPSEARFSAPVYEVRLVAAPAPQPEARRAPEVIERPGQQAQPVTQTQRPSVSQMSPPPPPDREMEREPVPRSTPDVEPLPGEEPSTGDDPATVSVSGVDFPFPEYLRNIVAQIYRRWQRPGGNQSLRAEILFFVRRDGSITNLQFVQRSGSFGFDLEAQGAIEAAGNSAAFGPLPDGFAGDILPVSFFFDPSITGR